MRDQPERQSNGSPPSPDELAAARFEFDKEVEDRKIQLEERKLKQARVDTWTRLFGTLAVGLLIAGGVQWYSIRSESDAKLRAETNQKVQREREQSAQVAQREREQSAQEAQVAIQLTNAREKALSDLRAQMFNALLQNYFKQATEQERIAILELIGLNFRDAVQIKPMFELLDGQLRTGAATPENTQLRTALRRAARGVIRDQLNQIRQAKDGGVCRMTLKVGEAASPQCFPQLRIKLRKVDQLTIAVRTNSKDGVLLGETDWEARGDDFVATYFDMPMVDYTAVLSSSSERWRYSVVLFKTAAEKKTAEIAVALLPISAVGPEHRYAFDELLEKYLLPKFRR